MLSIKGSAWFNDSVINAYFSLLQEDSIRQQRSFQSAQQTYWFAWFGSLFCMCAMGPAYIDASFVFRAFSSHVMVQLLDNRQNHVIDCFLPRPGAVVGHRYFLFPINLDLHWFFAVVTLASRDIVYVSNR
jgi:hypothetical protein